MEKENNTEQSSVKSRLIEFLKYKGVSQGDFEKTCGLSNGYVNNIRKSITPKTFNEKIEPNFPELNKTWLLLNEGDMLSEEDVQEKSNVTMIKERVIQLIETKDIAKEEFYKKIGMTSASFRGKAKETPLNSNAIENILSEIKDVNPEWLLTGRGQMLKEEHENQDNTITILKGERKTRDAIVDIQEVPLYDFEATAGLVELFKSEKQSNMLDTIKIPNIPACDGAIAITGDSMYPLLKSGDIIMYKEVPVDMASIFFGEMYLLGVMVDDTEEMITVKYVQRSDLGDDYIKLVSQNQHHQPKDVHLSRVTGMAMIKVSIRKNMMN